MSKVTKNTEKPTKPTIDLWDTDKIGMDAVYHYATPDLSEDDDCHQIRITRDELVEFVEENELNQFQTDVDDFSSYDAQDHLVDNWEDVKDRYWSDVLEPRLESSYNEAMAFIQSYTSKHKMTDNATVKLLSRVEANYGIKLRRVA
jgi:hypothetical protein